MPATYEPIATTTLGSAASNITFTSIPATYTDLRLVVFLKPAASFTPSIRYNGSGTGYSRTNLYGSGTSAVSSRASNTDTIQVISSGTEPNLFTLDIFSYAGSTYKTALFEQNRDSNGSGFVVRTVALWSNTSAINEIAFRDADGISNLASGTTATLYGILKA